MRTSPPVVNFSVSRGVRSALLLVSPALIMLPIHCTHVASRGGNMWVVLPHGGFCDALCMSWEMVAVIELLAASLAYQRHQIEDSSVIGWE